MTSKSNLLKVLVQISFVMLIFYLSSCDTQHRSDRALSNADVTVADRIRKSNVIYDVAEFQKGIMHVPPYIANGIVGGGYSFAGETLKTHMIETMIVVLPLNLFDTVAQPW